MACLKDDHPKLGADEYDRVRSDYSTRSLYSVCVFSCGNVIKQAQMVGLQTM